MASVTHQKRIEAARQLVTRLRSEGRNEDAGIVDRLARSSAVSAGLNSAYHDDLAHANERLRVAELEVAAARRAHERTGHGDD